jgi:hypothetical protein
MGETYGTHGKVKTLISNFYLKTAWKDEIERCTGRNVGYVECSYHVQI